MGSAIKSIGDVVTGNVFDFNKGGKGLGGFAGDITGQNLSSSGSSQVSGFTPFVNQSKAGGEIYAGNDTLNRIDGGQNIFGVARPDLITARTQDGQLDSRFQNTMGDSFSALRDKAMATGDSTWASLQRQGLQDQYSDRLGQMQQTQAGQQAQARTNMAMRGGLSSGARERMSQQGMNNNMFGVQGLGNNLAGNNLQLSIADEQMKNQALGQLGGVEQGIQSNNINRLLGDLQNQNLINTQNYGEDMGALAAQRSADAQAKAASRGNDKFLGLF